LKNKILKQTQMIATLTKNPIPDDLIRYSYFKYPEEIFIIKENNLYNYFDEMNLYSLTNCIDFGIDLEKFDQIGFYNIEDGYRFTNGNGILYFSNLLPSKNYIVYLDYFVPFNERFNINLGIIVNDNIKAINVKNSDLSGYILMFYFSFETIMQVKAIKIISDCFIPKEIDPLSEDIRLLGIAYKNMKIISIA
jgi:hypothetical protein